MKINKLFIIGFSSILLSAVATAGKGENGKDKKEPKKSPPTFEEVDTNKDGKISLEEYTKDKKNAEKAKKRFEKKDKNADGFLSKEEYKKVKGKKKPKKKPKKDEASE